MTSSLNVVEAVTGIDCNLSGILHRSRNLDICIEGTQFVYQHSSHLQLLFAVARHSLPSGGGNTMQ